MIIGTFGRLPFVCAFDYVLTFSDLSRENKIRWAKHDVIGRKPALEFVGEDLMTVSFKIRFDTTLGTPPLICLDRLKRMLENKQYKTLIIGGEYLGRYVIESISEERKFHTGWGFCQVAEATVTLTEWYDGKDYGEVISEIFDEAKDEVKGIVDKVTSGVSDAVDKVTSGITGVFK